MKKRTKYLLYGLIFVVLALFIQQSGLITQWSAFSATSGLPDNAKVLRQLQQQQAFLRLEGEQDFLLDSIKPTGKDKIVLAGHVSLSAGVDLRLLNETDLFIEADSIAIALPPAELINIKIDPSGFKVIQQEGSWTNDEILQVKANANTAWEQGGMRQQLTSRAEQRGRLLLDQFLQVLGFRKISLL